MDSESRGSSGPLLVRLGARPFKGGVGAVTPLSAAHPGLGIIAPPFASARKSEPGAQPDAVAAPGIEPDRPLTDAPRDDLERVRSALDEELTRFTLRESERPRVEEPFPALDPLAPNDVAAADASAPPRAQALEWMVTPVAPVQRTVSPSAIGLAEAASAAGVTDREDAPVTSAGDGSLPMPSDQVEVIAEALETVACRVRSGEIAVLHAAPRDEAGILAAVLAAMLERRA